jgi:hypothetical protein
VHGGIARGRNDPRYAAVWAQGNIRDCFGAAPQHQLDQGPRRTEERQAEIPLWQNANVRPLILNILCHSHWDGAGSRQIALETQENLTKCPEAASEQPMRVPILGSARPRRSRCREAVALQDLNLLEVFCQGAGHRQAADARPDHYRTPTQETVHDYAPTQSRLQIIARRLP